MRPFAVVLCAVAAAARAQNPEEPDRIRRAVVRIEASDAAVRRAKALVAANAAPDELSRVRIRQPLTSHEQIPLPSPWT